jgi:hypothetical protein
MFEYTKLVFNQTVNDIKRISTITDYAMQVVYIAYLIYAICVSDVILGVNIALLVISSAYLVFSVIMRVKELKKTDKNVKKKVKQVYKISKYTIQVPILVTAVITLTNLEDDKVTFSLLFTIMMIVCYVASILMAVTTNVLESRAKRFTVAIEADLEPIISVVNTVKRFKGEKTEVAETDKTKEKIRSELDEKVDKIREERFELENQAMSKADRAELWKIRKEIIHSLASKVKEKAKQKFKSLIKSREEPKTLLLDETTPALDEVIEKSNDLIEK